MKKINALLIATSLGLSFGASAATIHWSAGNSDIYGSLAIATDGTYTVGKITQIDINGLAAFQEVTDGYLMFTLQGLDTYIDQISPGGNKQLDVSTGVFANGFNVYQTTTDNYGSLAKNVPFGSTTMAAAFAHMTSNLFSATPWITGTLTSTDISFYTYLTSGPLLPNGTCAIGDSITSHIGDGTACDVTKYRNEAETVNIALTGGSALGNFTSDWDGSLTVTNNPSTQSTAYAYRGVAPLLTTTVPEPTTLAVLGLGAIAMGATGRRRSAKSNKC